MSEICIFGDSVGKGVTWNPVLLKYEALKLNLLSLFGRDNINIKNYSVFGSTISKGLNLAQRHERDLYKYDHVFLEFGGNDCDFDWADISKNPQADHQPKTPLHIFEKLYAELIEKVLKAKGKPVLLTLPPINAQKYFTHFSKDLQKKNLLSWLGDVEMIYRWHEMYSLAVTKLARQMSVPLVDVRSAFLSDRFCPDLLCDDGIHPTEKGHKLIYQTVLDSYK